MYDVKLHVKLIVSNHLIKHLEDTLPRRLSATETCVHTKLAAPVTRTRRPMGFDGVAERRTEVCQWGLLRRKQRDGAEEVVVVGGDPTKKMIITSMVLDNK